MVQNRQLPRRDKRLSFRLTDDEYAALERQAQQTGQNVSAFMRQAFSEWVSEDGRIQKGRARRPQDEGVPQCLAALARIHRNVEALGQWTERYREGADAVSIMAHLVAVEREIDRLRAELAARA
jgi:uncharacterized protein (DUF1778 family)